MSDHLDTTARPGWACVLHPAPKRVGAWAPAHEGYRTCDGCLDKLRDSLKDIADRWGKLDPTPGAYAEHGSRGAPGFASRPPASVHVIAMRDRRSKAGPVACDAVEYQWDYYSTEGHTPLPAGVHGPNTAGNYTSKREVWRGSDGRSYTEADRPTRSVQLVLAGIADLIAAERDMSGPTTQDVPELVRWLDAQLDWLTRQDWVADVAEQIRELQADLKLVTGEPGRQSIGVCPNTIDEGETTRKCGARLYAPTNGTDTIVCRSCDREWHRPEWLRLGNLLDAS